MNNAQFNALMNVIDKKIIHQHARDRVGAEPNRYHPAFIENSHEIERAAVKSLRDLLVTGE